MNAFERLKQVGLFTDLADDDLDHICQDVADVDLGAGEVLFTEGEPGDRAYVVVDGTIEVLKATEGRDALIAVRGPGTVIGEMALLHSSPRMATVRARTPAALLAIPKWTLDQLLESSPSAARSMFRSLLDRMSETSEQLRHSERMAQLGTLTAGVAHELNNPAAAVRRAAQRLAEELDRYTALLLEPAPDAGVARRRVLEVAEEAGAASAALVDTDRLDAVARADAEAEVEAWLDRHGVDDAWKLAPELVDGGLDVTRLDAIGDAASGAQLADAARLLVSSAALRALVAEIGEGTRRLSTIVQALKGYSYLDRAPVQDVDVVRGIEDTLVLLAHKTRGIRIERDFAPDLPTITAFGSELNQVWTNLIDNASDAVAGLEDRTPTIVLRTSHDDDDVVVEVEDNGPGIPADLQPKIFDAFFTTKPPGQGTGLGLQVSHRIVALEHGGELTVESEPGRTVFRVVLPIDGHAGATTGDNNNQQGEDPVAATICEDLRTVEDTPVPEGGCEECLALGDTWVHLRFCAGCGRIGCCDQSKNRHARRHAETSGHPVMRSKEPGENWAWCYTHELGAALGP